MNRIFANIRKKQHRIMMSGSWLLDKSVRTTAERRQPANPLVALVSPSSFYLHRCILPLKEKNFSKLHYLPPTCTLTEHEVYSGILQHGGGGIMNCTYVFLCQAQQGGRQQWGGYGYDSVHWYTEKEEKNKIFSLSLSLSLFYIAHSGSKVRSYIF
jgi:hypothetical protein